MEEQPLTPRPTKKSMTTSLTDTLTLPHATSFKEDSYFTSQLSPSQHKALQDLKHLLSSQPNSHPLSMWGARLPDDGDERSDVILLKFLRARDFHVARTHSMLLRCIEWRRELCVDGVVDEDLGLEDLEGVVACMHGVDRVGRPVCYNSYGLFRDREVYERVLGDEEKVKRFLRWRVQVMERGIRQLEFKPGGINSIVQIVDLKDMPRRDMRAASSQMLSLFQDNYPELVFRKIFVNVPWYFSALYSVVTPFLTQRTKSKLVVAKEWSVAETLYKYIRPEFIPIQYGGLSRTGEMETASPRPASEFTVKAGERVNLEIDGIEDGSTIKWEIVVGGWEIEYSAEYVPSNDQSYTIIIEKSKRVHNTTGGSIINSYTSKEPGKLVLSVDNTASRRRKVAAYRYLVHKFSV